MSSSAREIMRIVICALLTGGALLGQNTKRTHLPTFYQDVAPILQQRCQECHRPGEIGPMPLLTYENARPWAKSIKQAVVTRKMPPWYADPHFGNFSNDRSLTQAEIDTLSAWADGGAPAG